MKTIGLIGGMSWESTATYYRLINSQVKERLGGLHSAKILLWSFDFSEIAALQAAGDWDGATARMVDAGLSLKRAGAEALVICTNTMHKMAQEVEAAAQLPLLHIADATAIAIKRENFHTIGLLATQFTMEQEFYKGRLEQKHGIRAVVPDENGRDTVHRIIYEELCKGIVTEASKQHYLAVIDRLIGQGAQGIVLGCTEIGMLIQPEDVPIPVFDTTILHATAVVDYMLG